MPSRSAIRAWKAQSAPSACQQWSVSRGDFAETVEGGLIYDHCWTLPIVLQRIQAKAPLKCDGTSA